MRLLHTVSALALFLTAAPSLAEVPAASVAQGTRLAQLSEYALALLSDTRPASELSPEELTQRIRNLRQALRSEELPEVVTDQLKARLRQARSEVAARDEAASQAAAEQPQPEQSVPALEVPAADETAQIQPDAAPAPDAAPQLPSGVVALLSDTRPASELSGEELAARLRALRQASRLEELPADVKEQLQELQRQARRETLTREAASAEPPLNETEAEQPPAVAEETTPQAQPDPVQSEATPQLPEDVAALLNDPRPLGDLSGEDLAARTRELRQAARQEGLPSGVKEQLQSLYAQARSEADSRESAANQQGTEPPAPAADETAEAVPETSPQPEAAPQLPGNVTALLSDSRPLSEFSSDELTARARALRQAANLEELPASVKEQLRDLQRQARTEIEAHLAAANQNKPAADLEGAEQQPPEDITQPEAVPQLPEEIAALLNNTRALSELSADQLTARILDLQQAARNAELTPDIKEQLQSLQSAAQSELASREAAASQQIPQQDVPEQQVTELPSAEATAQAQPEAAPPLPDDITALLDDKRSLSALSADELNSRARALRQASRREDLPQAVKDQLRDLQREARAEAASREGAGQQTAEQAATDESAPESTPKDVSQIPPELAPAPQVSPEKPDAASLLSDERDANQLSPAELSARLRAARALAQDESLTQETRNRLTDIVKRTRRELMARDQAAGGSELPLDGAPAVTAPAAGAEQKQNAELPPATDQSDVQALDGNAANPAAEATARAYLQDQSALETLTDDALRRRVGDIRDLLASNELSRDTERSVRRKLRVERDTLRARVAERESRRSERRAAGQNNAAETAPSRNGTTGNGQVPGTAQGGSNTRVESNTQITTNNTEITTNITNITNLPPPRVVLADRRAPEELDEREIRWRISVYRNAVINEDYEAEERLAWQEQMEEDRRYLRRRLLQERERRAQELEIDFDESDIEDFDFSDEWDETAPPPRDVYADEVEDEELVKVLAAPPRRKVERRYSVAEIEARPQLRDTIARIEIDTLRFGFNEARVREEEIEKLDRIGEILERILRKSPREVFLIEGHTDAVGSDAYNLNLSRQRAEAVKEALTTYFVINPRNLQTAGFGERFLKIPTADAEEENRRVSIARATVLVGELSD